MSTKNRTYPIKIAFKSIIEKVFLRVYNQLPLQDVEYPFAVYEILILDTCPYMQVELSIDLWDNESNQLEFQNNIDDLINKLDFINYNDKTIHACGNIETIQDVVTQEEELIRCQIKGIYDIGKVE